MTFKEPLKNSEKYQSKERKKERKKKKKKESRNILFIEFGRDGDWNQEQNHDSQEEEHSDLVRVE